MARPKPENSLHGAVVVWKWVLSQGEVVPLHDHTTRPLSQHITIVAKGLVKINCPGAGETLTLVAGDLVDFTPAQQCHEILAIEDSIVFNIAKAVI